MIRIQRVVVFAVIFSVEIGMSNEVGRVSKKIWQNVISRAHFKIVFNFRSRHRRARHRCEKKTTKKETLYSTLRIVYLCRIHC